MDMAGPRAPESATIPEPSCRCSNRNAQCGDFRRYPLPGDESETEDSRHSSGALAASSL